MNEFIKEEIVKGVRKGSIELAKIGVKDMEVVISRDLYRGLMGRDRELIIKKANGEKAEYGYVLGFPVYVEDYVPNDLMVREKERKWRVDDD